MHAGNSYAIDTTPSITFNIIAFVTIIEWISDGEKAMEYLKDSIFFSDIHKSKFS